VGGDCVHIVDDDDDVLRTLAYAIASGGYASRVYVTAEQLLQALPTLAPGCIVTDVRMPGMSGLDLVRRLRSEAIDQPVIVMSGQADIALAVEAMKGGAVDFLQKPFRAAALLEAVRAAIENNQPKQAKSAEVVAFEQLVGTLTPRQRDVLEGIVDGTLNKTKAHDLGISVRTLEGYRAEVMAKTRVRNASDLVRLGTLARFYG